MSKVDDAKTAGWEVGYDDLNYSVSDFRRDARSDGLFGLPLEVAAKAFLRGVKEGKAERAKEYDAELSTLPLESFFCGE